MDNHQPEYEEDVDIKSPIGAFDEFREHSVWRDIKVFLSEKRQQLQDDLTAAQSMDEIRVLQGKIQMLDQVLGDENFDGIIDFLEQQKQDLIDLEQEQ